jgi:hypothetical protein
MFSNIPTDISACTGHFDGHFSDPDPGLGRLTDLMLLCLWTALIEWEGAIREWLVHFVQL